MLHPCLLRGVAWWCLWPWRSWYLLCWYSFPGEKMHLCGSNVITLLKTWQVASKLFQNIFICLADIALQYFHLRSWFTVRMNYTLKARSPAVQQALFLWTAYVRMHIGECSCLIVCCFCIFILYVLHISTFCAHRHTVHKTYISFWNSDQEHSVLTFWGEPSMITFVIMSLHLHSWKVSSIVLTMTCVV